MLGRRPGALAALLVAILLSGSHLALAVAPAGDWWDTSYAWRRKITLTDSGSGTPAGTVVSLTVDHASLVAGGKSQADGDDVRIAHWDGANWTELSRALSSDSSWNDGSTRILFKVPMALAASGSSDNYYLYFGNPLAAAPVPSVPTARWYKAEQLVEQSTGSAAFVDVPGTTLTFTPGDASETWLIFVSGVVRSSSNNATSAEMRMLINGVEADLWGHQNNGSGTPNGAGFLIPGCITGTAAPQTIQAQFRAGGGNRVCQFSSRRRRAGSAQCRPAFRRSRCNTAADGGGRSGCVVNIYASHRGRLSCPGESLTPRKPEFQHRPELGRG